MKLATTVERLEVVHKGPYVSGFHTVLVVDGKHMPEQSPPRYEQSISVSLEAKKPICVQATFRDGSKQLFEPKNFLMVLGDLKVETRHNRYPCAVEINGHDVRCRSLKVEFKRDEAVWVNVTFMPREQSTSDRSMYGPAEADND